MLMKTYQLIFFVSLITGTVMACSSNSWFLSWLGLEINLMMLIPLIVIKFNSVTSEAAIKYFLAQAMGSILLIFSSSIDAATTYALIASETDKIILCALVIKAGMAPFHFWFPQVMLASNWTLCLIILTWQKVAPFMLMSFYLSIKLLMMFILASLTVGMMGGLNQIFIKNILTYSSIAHSGWMAALFSISLNGWLMYFLIYTFITVSIICMMFNLSLFKMNEIFLTKTYLTFKIVIIMSLLSLGGLPPLLGFLGKLNAIMLIMTKMNPIFITTMILASLLSLFYYMKLIYNSMLNLNQEIKMTNFKSAKNNPNYITIVVIVGNLTAPLLVSLT